MQINNLFYKCPKDFLKLISTEERSLDMKSRWLTTWLSAYFSPTTIGLQEVDKDFINNFLGPRICYERHRLLTSRIRRKWQSFELQLPNKETNFIKHLMERSLDMKTNSRKALDNNSRDNSCCHQRFIEVVIIMSFLFSNPKGMRFQEGHHLFSMDWVIIS